MAHIDTVTLIFGAMPLGLHQQGNQRRRSRAYIRRRSIACVDATGFVRGARADDIARRLEIDAGIIGQMGHERSIGRRAEIEMLRATSAACVYRKARAGDLGNDI